MKDKTKIFLAIMFLLVGILVAGTVLAADKVTAGASATTAGADPVTVVGNFYKLALMVSGFLAFAMIVFGAFKYTIAAGNPSGQSDAKDTILQALLGLLLLLGAYIILQTINPAILSTQIPGLAPLQAPAQSNSSNNSPTPGGPSGTCDWKTYPQTGCAQTQYSCVNNYCEPNKVTVNKPGSIQLGGQCDNLHTPSDCIAGTACDSNDICVGDTPGGGKCNNNGTRDVCEYGLVCTYSVCARP